MQMGHVAGTAAALSLRHDTDPVQLPIEILQYKLRTEGMILKLRELGPFNDYKVEREKGDH
jgi:hypothetical protein